MTTEPFEHSEPLPLDEVARQVRAMGPVAHIRGPLSAQARKACTDALIGECDNIENFTVDSFRMQTIDVAPGRRVVMYEIEYDYEP
jgi:hypothetical protein